MLWSSERIRALEPVAVVGYGVEGRATTEFLLRHGVRDAVVCDRAQVAVPQGVSTRTGEGYLDGLDRFRTVFRSPGMRPDLPAFAAARQAGAWVTTALELFLRLCPCRTVGITGTVGKGTCATATAACVAAGGRRVFLGGNIGKNPLEFVDELNADDVVVLEVSSFQAMGIGASPQVVCFLKTTSEHLDWHHSVEEYRGAKADLAAHLPLDGAVVFNADDPGASWLAGTAGRDAYAFSTKTVVERGVGMRDGQLVWCGPDGVVPLPLREGAVALRGRFNLENLAAAVLNAALVGVDPGAAARAAAAFRGLEHRLEPCAQGGGVEFFNDSYATRPDATMAAVDALGDRPLALILGGSDKGADFGALVRVLERAPIRRIALIGQTAPVLEQALSATCLASRAVRCADLETAVATCVDAVRGGGAVVLSPACASFGMFANYKERGMQFKELARRAAAALRGEA